MHKENQFLVFPLLSKQGKPVTYAMVIYTIHIYYSKHGTSDVDHFEMTDNHNCSKGMAEQKQGLPSVPSKQG